MNSIELMAPDLVRAAFIIGMVLSVFLYEKSHLTTGSIVVPGFLGIHLFEPHIALFSIVNAALCFWLIHRLAPRFVFMSNRSKFQALVIVSAMLQVSWNLLSLQQTSFAFAGDLMSGLGYVIPGLIAHDMARNGCGKTAINTLLASYIVGAIVFVLLLLLPKMSLSTTETPAVNFRTQLLMVVALSTMGAVLLKSMTSIPSGGYVTAAYLVFFGFSPILLTLILLAACLTYYVNCKLLIPNMIIFGRRKFALMLIIGAWLMWMFQLCCDACLFSVPLANHPAYAGILILLPGLIANDMHRTSARRVSFGLGVLVAWVCVAVCLYRELSTYARPTYLLPLASCLGFVFLAVFVNQRLFIPRPTASTIEQGASS